MTRRSHLTVVLFLACLVSGRCSGEEAARLRVLCYNIHHAEGIDRKLDVLRIARVIQSVNPDLVALQEVDQRAKRTGFIDQLAEISRLTNLKGAFGANIPLQGGHYGNAILSRFPITKHKNSHLPNTDGGEQRGVLVADIAVPNLPAPLTFMATHFDHRKADAQRFASAQFINGLVADSNGPAILAGDLNDVKGSRTLNELAKHWTNPAEQTLPTIPVAKPTRQIDFIMLRPRKSSRAVEVRVLEEAVASDHRAILAVVQWQK